MKLILGDTIIDNPTPSDIGRGIPRGAVAPNWSLELDAGDGLSLAADAAEGGQFTVAYVENTRLHAGDRPCSRKELEAIVQLFLSRDPRWRGKRRWTADKGAASGGSQRAGILNVLRDNKHILAGIVLMALPILFSMTNAFGLGNLSLADLRMPRAFDSIAARIIAIFTSLVSLLLFVAFVWKKREEHATMRWKSTPGRVVASGVGVSTRTGIDGDTQVRNVPSIRYEYEVDGKRLTGQRIDLSEIPQTVDRDATLQRYPRGATVTVYYNPARPTECVLERNLMQGHGLGCLTAIAAGLAAIMGLMWLVTHGPASVAAILPNAQPHIVLLTSLLGLVLLAMFFAEARRMHAARNWPSTSGVVVRSEVEEVTSSSDSSTGSLMPFVMYRYSVAGQHYHARQIKLGMTSGGSLRAAEKQIAPFPVGKTVTVHYDPEQPADAALIYGSGHLWVLGGLAALLFAVAVYASGVLHS